jgi:hypothetical protein
MGAGQPSVVEAILDDRQPDGGLPSLMRPLPLEWRQLGEELELSPIQALTEELGVAVAAPSMVTNKMGCRRAGALTIRGVRSAGSET